MKKFLKIVLWIFVSLFAAIVLILSVYIYKIKNGFPVSYETTAPAITFPPDQPAILLFSKSSGFRHGPSIDAAKVVFAELAKRNHWFLYDTEEGGVFNSAQLEKFQVIIFNNSTGEVLNGEQKKALETFVENGGSLVGIHGSGDDSHNWAWYEKNLIGVPFSHHPLSPHLQWAEVTLEAIPDSTLARGLKGTWTQNDEWYVFFENPRAKGFTVLYTIPGDKIIPNGNMLWMTDKNFGMGKDHPVAWYKRIGKGRTLYTSMGHDETVWKQAPFVKLIENAVTPLAPNQP